MNAEIGAGPTVVIFCPDGTETSTIKRAQGFIDRGYGVTILSFRRGRYNRDFVPPWASVDLGKTADGRYWHRLWAVLRAAPLIFREAPRLRRTTVFYARNLDQLVMAVVARWMLGSEALIVYEVLDIPQIMTGRGPASKLLRLLERSCLRRIKLLVVSSPGFHARYFTAMQHFTGDWLLLENKLHRSILDAAPAVRGAAGGHEPRRGGRPWVIGYFGLIRGNATLDLIVRLAERLGDRVQFRFRGVLTTIGEERFAAALRRCPNIVFGGAYVNPDELPRLYDEVDFAWAIDLEHGEHNSRWLLPCRFYEAGYFGVPCLAVREFEIGRLVDRLNVGWTFPAPLEDSLARFFETLTPDAYRKRQGALHDQPTSLFVAGEEMDELCARLHPVRRAPQAQCAASTVPADATASSTRPMRKI